MIEAIALLGALAAGVALVALVIADSVDDERRRQLARPIPGVTSVFWAPAAVIEQTDAGPGGIFTFTLSPAARDTPGAVAFAAAFNDMGDAEPESPPWQTGPRSFSLAYTDIHPDVLALFHGEPANEGA